MEDSLHILQQIIIYFNEQHGKPRGYQLKSTVMTHNSAALVFELVLRNTNTEEQVSGVNFLGPADNIRLSILASINNLATSLGMW